METFTESIQKMGVLTLSITVLFGAALCLIFWVGARYLYINSKRSPKY